MDKDKKVKIAIASDHSGFELRQALMAARPDIEWLDIGAGTLDPLDDYPDYGFTLAMAVAGGHAPIGVGVCGSGQGMAMALNRHPYIRAALCNTVELARLAREHNAANVLCLGGRLTELEDALKILQTFIDTPFSAEERHTRRVQKLTLHEDTHDHDHGEGGCCGDGSCGGEGKSDAGSCCGGGCH